MNRPFVIFVILTFIVFATGFLLVFNGNIMKVSEQDENAQANRHKNNQVTMKIASSAFEHNKTIPEKYTCDGENINPPLEFSDIPHDARSLVLISDDPDAPVGLWVHWVMWNISPDTNEIKENSLPPGAVEGVSSFDKAGYGGPCPPSGEHRYFFKVYALDTELNLAPDSGKEDLEEAMVGHVIDKAELIGLYSR